MKTYTFTEIELKNKIDRLQGTYHNTLDLVDSDILVKELIEGKNSVELLAEGEVWYEDDDESSLGGDWFIGNFCIREFIRQDVKVFTEEQNTTKRPEQLIEKDNPESIPDMYDEDADRFDRDRKENAERWDR